MQKKIFQLIGLFVIILTVVSACNFVSTEPPADIEITGNEKLDDYFKKLYVLPYTYPLKPIEFSLKNRNGAEVTLKQHQGKVIFLNFWATWCSPCLEEMPDMEKMYNKMDKKNFEMIAISIDKKKSDLDNYLKNSKISFPILFDQGEEVYKKYSRGYGITAIPTTLILNQKGDIIGMVEGPRKWSEPDPIDFFNLLIKEK